jgi:succinoglycan biosynthesis protein ExoM
VREKLRTSYLVPTFRRPRELASCLDSLLAQRGFDAEQDEICVVDNCPDQSAAALVASKPGVRYAHEPVPGVAAVRNHAFRIAKGEVYVLLDDDQEADPGLTETLREGMQQHQGDLGFAAIDAVLEGVCEGPIEGWEKLFARTWEDPEGPLLQSRVPALSTGGVMVRRDAVREVFGDREPFDLRLGQTGGEDIAFFRLMRKSGKRLLWLPRARITERVPAARLTRAFLLERRFSSGQLRTHQEGEEARIRTLAFMAMGAAQATLGAARFAVAKVTGNERAVLHEADIVAGLGKVLFFGPFRKKRYGVAAKKRKP